MRERKVALMQDGKFKLKSSFKPTGDQPQAIAALTEGILAGERAQDAPAEEVPAEEKKPDSEG